MDSSRAPTFDDYRKQLQMVLEDPNDEAPVAVSFDYLKTITDDFSDKRLIGRGGFGEVYRGVLGRDKYIAIKKLYAEQLVDDRKYQAELDTLLRVQHKNIVLLIGYCAETKKQLMPQNGGYVLAEVRERLLCFEYISNGSLDDLIPKLKIFENEDVEGLLGWDTRYAIMEGICRGLAFLHEECKLIHMDLKPENILMDSNMVPKITEFALSRLRPKDAEKSTVFTQTITGTLGYMPPEFLLKGEISLKTDIYSLGVIMCQIITGEREQQGMELLIQRTCGKWMKIFEKSLNHGSIKENYVNQVKQMIDIALKCMDHDRAKRPSSSEILQIFNLNPAERSSSELNSKCGQAIELLSVHPLQLDFSSPDTKKLNCSSCSLHGHRMDSSRAPTFDDYRKQLQMVLEDPNDEAPVAVSFDYLKTITDDFSDERLIGRGGFGEVYRGVLGSDKYIAIKKLYAEQLADDRKYQAELDSLMRVQHKNIVLLIGYCAETKMQLMPRYGGYVMAEVRERLLCFEYISNGSLADLIPKLKIFENEDVEDLLGWDTRYAIMEGICRGLAFLHEECKLAHMDLKPENILMDSNMVPKISDFALSRPGPKDAEKSTVFTQTVTGTLGYMPPEFLLEGKISLKTDIYSLGVIMCQIIIGEKVQQGMELLIQRTCGKWMKIFEKSLNDASIKEKYVNQVKQMIDIALKCMDHDRAKRPSSSEILQIFNLNPAERSSSELNCKCGQAILQLDFSSPDTKKLNCSSCSLHLTNILPSSETLPAHYFWPRSGVVPPKCRMEHMDMEFDLLESVLCGSESPRHLKLPFLQFITKNFSDELKIGSGGCGVVYKGILRNQIIAVKRLLNSHTIEDKMFHREVKSLMMVNHKNVVQFLGYCSNTEEQALKMEGQLIMAEDRERLLCFEYLINGNLESYLADELRGLEWQTRYQIIKGIGDGLDHLHSENHIIHMDLKPANILLDSNMVPKITDFGVSRMDNTSQTMSSERLVSLGYCAPEYLHHGKMSAKSDIYSLGKIILELVTGSKEDPNITKVHRRWKHRWNKTAKDAQLGYKQVATCLDLVGRCIQREPTHRPNIRDIISCLNEMDSSDAKISEGATLEDMLGVEPLEIHLPFELNKQISCSVELTNDTNGQFAFRISTTSLRPYCVEAKEGIVPPRSKCIVTISLQAMDKSLPGHQRRDEFSVQSTRLDGGSLVGMNIGGGDIFNEEPGRVIDMVDFSVVLISEAASPSPWTSSTTELEALSEQPEEDTVNPLAYLDNRDYFFA